MTSEISGILLFESTDIFHNNFSKNFRLSTNVRIFLVAPFVTGSVCWLTKVKFNLQNECKTSFQNLRNLSFMFLGEIKIKKYVCKKPPNRPIS